MADRELETMADEELIRALSLSYRELVKVTPWGDTHEAFAPTGRPVQVERNYLWAAEPGEAVLVEVAVFVNTAFYDEAARRSRVVKPPQAR